MNTITLLYAAGALLIVLLLVVLAGRAARATGFAKPAASARLQVLEKLALDPRRRLLLLRCDGRDVMLLTGPHNDVVIGWMSAAPLNPDPGAAQ